MTGREGALEVAKRYVNDDAHKEWSADDYDVIMEAVWDRFSEDEHIILQVFNDIQAQYTRGHRCSVCGMTQKQSQAANYNCVREC